MKSVRKWRFYVTTVDGQDITTKLGSWKDPSRTAEWKRLETLVGNTTMTPWGVKKIRSVSYELQTPE